MQNRNRLIDIENKFMVTKGERKGEKDKLQVWAKLVQMIFSA